MKLLRLIIILSILTVSSAYSEASDGGINFNVLTYNLKMIPCYTTRYLLGTIVRGVSGKKCPDEGFHTLSNKERAIHLKKLIEKMKVKPDVIFLQEAFESNISLFEDSYIEDILKNLEGYHFYAFGPESPKKYEHQLIKFQGFKFKQHSKDAMNSGLIIASRHPITSVDFTRYKSCNIDDCSAVKGVVHAKIYLEELDEEISVINTHMQAHLKYEGTRKKQLKTIEHFLERSDVADMAIFAGDFNFRNTKDYQTYKLFKKTFPEFKDSSLVCNKFKKCRFKNATKAEKKGNILDHVFYKNKHDCYNIYPTRINIKHYPFKKRTLSDHKAVFVRFRIE